MHIDRFSTADHLNKRTRTYADVKAVVLKAGRFSVFEAQDDPGMFTQLCRDPELETDHTTYGYPWTAVRLKAKP